MTISFDVSARYKGFLRGLITNKYHLIKNNFYFINLIFLKRKGPFLPKIAQKIHYLEK